MKPGAQRVHAIMVSAKSSIEAAITEMERDQPDLALATAYITMAKISAGQAEAILDEVLTTSWKQYRETAT